MFSFSRFKTSCPPYIFIQNNLDYHPFYVDSPTTVSAKAQEEKANIVNLNLVAPRKWLVEPGNVYIGRQTRYLEGSKWGNPYIMKGNMKRNKVVKLFKEGKKLLGKKLGCWCAPQQCHGEILHLFAGNRPVYSTI